MTDSQPADPQSYAREFVQSMIDAGFDPNAQTQAPKFIGVPEGYAAPDPGFGPHRSGYVPATKPPLYTEKDLFTPRTTLSPEDIARLQAQMARAGLYGTRPRYINGRWDEASVGAYEKLLRYANQGGVTDRDALAELTVQGDSDGDGIPDDGGPEDPASQFNFVSPVTDPAAARQTLRSALRSKLGRNPSKVEYDEFVSALSSTTSTAAPVIGQAVGSEETDPVEEFADNYTTEKFGAEQASYGAATTYYDAFMQVIGGS